jgi:hypothetical protein
MGLSKPASSIIFAASSSPSASSIASRRDMGFRRVWGRLLIRGMRVPPEETTLALAMKLSEVGLVFRSDAALLSRPPKLPEAPIRPKPGVLAVYRCNPFSLLSSGRVALANNGLRLS